MQWRQLGSREPRVQKLVEVLAWQRNIWHRLYRLRQCHCCWGLSRLLWLHRHVLQLVISLSLVRRVSDLGIERDYFADTELVGVSAVPVDLDLQPLPGLQVPGAPEVAAMDVCTLAVVCADKAIALCDVPVRHKSGFAFVLPSQDVMGCPPVLAHASLVRSQERGHVLTLCEVVDAVALRSVDISAPAVLHEQETKAPRIPLVYRPVNSLALIELLHLRARRRWLLRSLHLAHAPLACGLRILLEDHPQLHPSRRADVRAKGTSMQESAPAVVHLQEAIALLLSPFQQDTILANGPIDDTLGAEPAFSLGIGHNDCGDDLARR
mmetsp:Transcript_88621/g.246045  ORF Transcript_88621/g.246045 Transcript_88621/m.246045 type:complete len:323 (-) Transcript_88621:696-1664(-)